VCVCVRIISEKIQEKTFIFSLFFIASLLVKKNAEEDEEEEGVLCRFSKKHLIAAPLNFTTVYVRTVRAAAEQSEHDFSSKALVSFVFTPTTRSERTSDADEEEEGDDEGVFIFFFPRSLPFYNTRQYTKADDA